jgi:hypothetical protein
MLFAVMGASDSSHRSSSSRAGSKIILPSWALRTALDPNEEI